MQVEFKSLSGLMVQLDAATVRNTLTRGNGKVSDQEVAMFLRTCQAKALDPLENGEVYLIKYDDKAPAQLVVGCHAYIRRADHFPDYRGHRSGITVIRNNQNGVPMIANFIFFSTFAEQNHCTNEEENHFNQHTCGTRDPNCHLLLPDSRNRQIVH